MAHHSNGSASGFSFSQITRHEEYHINGGDLFFLVEHVQFRVHRYFFERESVVFRKQLMTPASPGASRQGTSESSAIILEDVRSSDFAKFLWVFYNPKYSLYNTSTDDWTIILDLAHRWEFPEVQNLVVRELEKLDLSDVTRVSVYHKYGVDRNLLLPRYAALCEREEPLSLREGMLLGMETTLNIARAREYARANRTPSGARSPGIAGLERDEMRSLVREMFNVKPLDNTGDQDESTSTPSGGLVTVYYPKRLQGYTYSGF
ncbi:hypothetical protein BDZ94DRAFT_1158248 [Collybia nuda]|uniref:BTB domain-containing protein n=1 Tax=Collybia nuda TaxID=64659 RepID=A0A9P6CLF9_9AGAR|nr:hypothetical protein BDZ94DRAFT_1158248 [Collybia nuda]